MTWWDQVLNGVWDPAWTAGLLQSVAGSIVGTLLALLGAGWILITQLRHDRELAARQALEARESWDADRCAAAANEVGLLLLDAADEIIALDEAEWVRRIHATTPPADSLYAIIDRRRIPGMDQVMQAKRKAEIALKLDSAIGDLQSEIEANWWASIQLTYESCLNGLTTEQTETVLHRVSRVLLWPSRDALNDLGRSLCRWDGRGTPPGLREVGEWKPTARGFDPPDGPECTQLIQAAVETATTLTETLGYRSQPSLGS